MDEQSALPCPIVMPFLGLLEKIELRVYFMGDGEELALNKSNYTWLYLFFDRSQRKVLFYLGWMFFHSRVN
jgi:hypothetical protein